MEKEEVLALIILEIDKKLNFSPNDSEKYVRFYIGKTSDYKRRFMEHRNGEEFNEEGMHYVKDYNEMYELVIGKPDIISELERDLITHYKEHPLNGNKKCGGGNPNATTLYIALKMQYVGDDKSEIYSLDNDVIPFSDVFPITINNK